MTNRKLSRRDALRAGAIGTVGLAAGAGGLSLPALGQGPATQDTTRGSHHDMMTVGQLAPGSFDPTGFLTRFENLTGRNKAGKAMLSLSEGAKVLQPAPVGEVGSDRIVAVTSAGHLLAFPVADLPELDRGKGNKIIEIPKARRGTERVVAVAVVPPGGTLVVKSGARAMSLSFKDLGEYLGARASRGGLLPRGWQKVDALHVE